MRKVLGPEGVGWRAQRRGRSNDSDSNFTNIQLRIIYLYLQFPQLNVEGLLNSAHVLAYSKTERQTHSAS